jgi:hypothetical protein
LEVSGRATEIAKATFMTQSGHRPASHVAIAKPVSTSIKALG